MTCDDYYYSIRFVCEKWVNYSPNLYPHFVIGLTLEIVGGKEERYFCFQISEIQKKGNGGGHFG